MNTAKLLGIDSDTSVCECCGKSNLKRVAVIELANGQIVRYGRDCAARKLGKATGKSIDLAVEMEATRAKMSAFIAKWSDKYEPNQIVKAMVGRYPYYVEYKNNQFVAIESRDKQYVL